MKALALVVLCGCSQIFGLNSPSHGTPIDAATGDSHGSDDAAPQGCTTIADCPTSVCLPTGACAADGDVAWLDPASTVTTPCTMAMPCYRMLDALATRRPYIRVHGTVTNLSSISQQVSIFGEPGAGLSGGSQLSIQSTVNMYDLTLQTCLSANSGSVLTVARSTVTGCSNNYGINAAGALTVDRCQITGNRGTGIFIAAGGGTSAQFSITNSFIVNNGNQLMGPVGGVYINASTVAAGSRLDFNTIVDNGAKNGGSASAGGVYCNDAMFSARSNIIAHNNIQGDVNVANANTQGACVFTGSLVESDDQNLAFPMGDYHLGAGSVAIDAAMTPPTTDHDIDGDPRPMGNGYDIGADEYP